jgi:hypothetical protein
MKSYRQHRSPTLDLNQANEAALMLVRGILMPGVKAVLAIGWLLLVGGIATATAAAMTMGNAGRYASAATFGDGPSPTSMQTGNMPQASLTVHYNKAFMKWLAANLFMYRMCTPMTQPAKSGLTFRNFMLNPAGPDLVQQTQGTVGSPLTIACNFRDIQLGQWANYINFSDFTFMTSISDDLMNYRKMLAYVLGQTYDDLIMANFDFLRTLDTNTTDQDSTIGPLFAFTKQIIEQMPASLSQAKVRPMPQAGRYIGKIMPAFIGDMTALDNTNNSIIDMLKHTGEGQTKLEELTDEDEGEKSVGILRLFGADWFPSTNCTATLNWQGSGLTGFSTYLAGEDAMVRITLESARHTNPGVKWENLDLWAGEYARSAYDGAGVIAAGTSYNMISGIGPSPDNTSRARISIAVPQTT